MTNEHDQSRLEDAQRILDQACLPEGAADGYIELAPQPDAEERPRRPAVSTGRTPIADSRIVQARTRRSISEAPKNQQPAQEHQEEVQPQPQSPPQAAGIRNRAPTLILLRQPKTPRPDVVDEIHLTPTEVGVAHTLALLTGAPDGLHAAFRAAAGMSTGLNRQSIRNVMSKLANAGYVDRPETLYGGAALRCLTRRGHERFTEGIPVFENAMDWTPAYVTQHLRDLDAMVQVLALIEKHTWSSFHQLSP